MSASKEFLGRGWSFPLAVDAAGGIALVEHEEDVRQAVPLILLTSRGERPMRPRFGSGLQDSVFATLSSTTLGSLQAEIRAALVEWEPRIEVLAVTVEPAAGEEGTLLVDLDYRVRATNNRFNLVFPYYLEQPA